MAIALWNRLGSPWLTVALTVLICIDTAVGSIFVLRHRAFYEELDREVLFPYLISVTPQHPELTLWIWVLIGLTALFAVNTLVCTADRVYRIFKKALPKRAILPQLVHIGFLVALLGHLVGSISGFRSYGNMAIEGVPAKVPHTEGLYMRLDGVEAAFSPVSGLRALDVGLTLIEDNRVVRTASVSINQPLIYRGIAFYYATHGRTLRSFVLNVDGRRLEVPPDVSFVSKAGVVFYFGSLYETPQGVPAIEVVSATGKRAYLRLTPASTVELEGSRIELLDLRVATYGVFTIHKDSGIWLIALGSLVLVVGMVGLMFVREDRGELIS